MSIFHLYSTYMYIKVKVCGTKKTYIQLIHVAMYVPAWQLQILLYYYNKKTTHYYIYIIQFEL